MNFPVKIIVGYEDGQPVYYKEGNWDSRVDTLPTGDDAADVADGSWAIDTNPSNDCEVSQYNKETDAWTVRFTISD